MQEATSVKSENALKIQNALFWKKYKILIWLGKKYLYKRSRFLKCKFCYIKSISPSQSYVNPNPLSNQKLKYMMYKESQMKNIAYQSCFGNVGVGFQRWCFYIYISSSLHLSIGRFFEGHQFFGDCHQLVRGGTCWLFTSTLLPSKAPLLHCVCTLHTYFHTKSTDAQVKGRKAQGES